MAKQLPRNWAEMRREWPGLSAYQRFEAFVASVLTLVVGVVILVALYRLIVSVVDTLLFRALNPLQSGQKADRGRLSEATPASVAALAGLVVSLGVTYWLMRERDDRQRRDRRLARAPAAPAGA